jgi:hypothetical protein
VLRHGAGVDQLPDALGRTPLAAAACGGRLEVVAFLVEQARVG